MTDREALRERIETNLRHAERRDDDFYRGKAAAFRVVLSMLDGPSEPSFICGRAERCLDCDMNPGLCDVHGEKVR